MSLLLFPFSGCVFAFAESEVYSADKPVPTPSEWKSSREALSNTSKKVQGSIRIYRSEVANYNALTKSPTDAGVPLILDGQLWRNGDQLRVDYRRPEKASNGEETFVIHSFACDSKAVYSLSDGVKGKTAALSVYERTASDAIDLLKFGELNFLEPIDSLWRGGGLAYADLVQRPDSRTSSIRSPSGELFFLVVVKLEDGSQISRFEFEAGNGFPFLRHQTEAHGGGLLQKVERQVVRSQNRVSQLPSRIVDILDVVETRGYTRVIELDLEPLADVSPLSVEMSPDSFRDLGVGFQVYYEGKANLDVLGKRYSPQTPVRQRTISDASRQPLFWVNGGIVLAVLAFILYRAIRQGNRK